MINASRVNIDTSWNQPVANRAKRANQPSQTTNNSLDGVFKLQIYVNVEIFRIYLLWITELCNRRCFSFFFCFCALDPSK